MTDSRLIFGALHILEHLFSKHRSSRIARSSLQVLRRPSQREGALFYETLLSAGLNRGMKPWRRMKRKEIV